MIVGFTGSRHPRPAETLERLRALLLEWGATEGHHGDCLGFDAQAHDICVELGIRTVIHPPTDARMRAWKTGDVELPEKPYLDRNKDIVLAVQKVIAAPDGPERARSGTWSTVRFAKSKGVRGVVLAWPAPTGVDTAMPERRGGE